MGEFYEMFFEDAEAASRALGLTLTRRGKHEGKPIPMAGIPVHSKDTHVGRLVRAGFPVVVCDQVEVGFLPPFPLRDVVDCVHDTCDLAVHEGRNRGGVENEEGCVV